MKAIPVPRNHKFSGKATFLWLRGPTIKGSRSGRNIKPYVIGGGRQSASVVLRAAAAFRLVWQVGKPILAMDFLVSATFGIPANADGKFSTDNPAGYFPKADPITLAITPSPDR